MMRKTLIQALVFALTSASPISPRQAVTEAIAPSAPPPPGCTPLFAGTFGLAVLSLTSTQSPLGKRKEPVHRAECDEKHSSNKPRRCTCMDEVASASVEPAAPMTVAQVKQIGDGQVQGGLHTVAIHPINQISDGQIQNWRVAYGPRVFSPPSTTIPPATASASDLIVSAAATRGDELDASDDSPLPTALATTSNTTTVDAALASANDSSTEVDTGMVSCLTPSSLQLHLSNGTLTDAQGRTGYIASNYQFQFDKPPQSEALYTAGWAVCGGHNANLTLSLGGSAVFWQCLSGDFYNLYDRYWAGQCSPVTLRVVELVDCEG